MNKGKPETDRCRVPASCPSPFPSGLRTVGIFSPAGTPEPAKLKRGCACLRGWGLKVVTAGGGTGPDRYLAADDAARVTAFHDLLRNPQIDLIVATRGGFGCVRLLEKLDWALWQRRQTPLVGYSDVSILHLAAFKAGIVTGVAGPMLASDLGRELRNARDGRAFAFAMRSSAKVWGRVGNVSLPRGVRLQVLKPGAARGPIMPVTLSVLVSLLGTPYMPSLAGVILVVEDVKEPAYKLDRYLTQLRQAGVLAGLAGLVFASFSDGEDAEWLPAIFAEFAEHVNGPVLTGLPYGHCFPSVSLPVGRVGVLEAGKGRAALGWEAGS